MLSIEDIAHLQLAKYRIREYEQMPAARECKRLTRWLTAVADAALGEIMGIPPDEFEAQLAAARDMGAAYLHAHDDMHISGISAYASVIRHDNILDKSLILPENATHKDRRLKDHYILGVFIVGNAVDLMSNNDTLAIQDVKVAGWIDHEGIQTGRVALPARFRSALPVVAVPCRNLYAMNEFMPRLNAETVDI